MPRYWRLSIACPSSALLPDSQSDAFAALCGTAWENPVEYAFTPTPHQNNNLEPGQ